MFHLEIPPLHRGRPRVLEAMSLDLPRGSVTAVVGPNGAGKSTLLRAIAGLGHEAVTIRDGTRILGRREIGFLPQAFEVRSDLSVLDCILLGRREDMRWRVTPEAIASAHALLADFKLGDLSARPMTALSGGQQQRVLLVQRIYRGSALMALDEPTSALDLHHQLSSLAALRSHARTTGAAVIAALHDLTLAARYCDTVLLLADGRMICHAPPEAALSPELVGKYWQIAPEFLQDRDGHLVVVPHAIEQDVGENCAERHERSILPSTQAVQFQGFRVAK
jgi:iron complex transport system ATP-binding protein